MYRLFVIYVHYMLLVQKTHSYVRNSGDISHGQPPMSTTHIVHACLSSGICHICHGSYVTICGDTYHCDIYMYHRQLEASYKSCVYRPLLYIDYRRSERQTSYQKASSRRTDRQSNRPFYVFSFTDSVDEPGK